MPSINLWGNNFVFNLDSMRSMLGAGSVPYLLEKQLEPLKHYKYHSVEGTHLEYFLNDYWWTPLATVVPSSIHPNTLTCAGFLASMVAFIIAMATTKEYLLPMPRWAAAVVVFLLFLYQSLDAIDGKQARRLQLSSPMGQLFDHGCDSLTVFFHAFIITATVELGTSRWTAYCVTALATQLFMYTWWEMRYGVFRCSTGGLFGVTEGQNTVMVITMFAVIWPRFYRYSIAELLPKAWSALIPPDVMFNTISFIIVVSAVYLMIAKDLASIISQPPPGRRRETVKDLLLFFVHLGTNVVYIFSPAYQASPFLVAVIISCQGSLLAWRIILATLTKSTFSRSKAISLPFYSGSVLSFLSLSPFVNKFIAFSVACVSVWMLGLFICINIQIVKEYLGIRLFHVPNNFEAKNTKKVS